MRSALLVIAALVAVAPPLRSSAQFVGMGSGAMYNNPSSALCDTMVWNGIHRRMLEKRIGVRGQSPSARQPSSGSRSEPVRPITTYRCSDDDSAERRLARMVAAGKEDQARFVRYFQQVWASYVPQAEAQGFKDDVAFALAFFVAGNWQVCARKDVPPAAASALAAQMRGFIADVPQLARATDRQKEAFARGLVELTALVVMGHQEASKQGDERARDSFARGAANNLKALLGVGPDRIRITEKGMVVR